MEIFYKYNDDAKDLAGYTQQFGAKHKDVFEALNLPSWNTVTTAVSLLSYGESLYRVTHRPACYAANKTATPGIDEDETWMMGRRKRRGSHGGAE